MTNTSSVADSVPSKFYKYRSIFGQSGEFVKRTVCEDEIYFPPPASFNDPFDCRPAFSFDVSDEELVADYIRIAKKHGPPMSDRELHEDAMKMLADPARNPKNPDVCAAIQDRHSEVMTNAVGVFCVSTVRDDILMWSHYADCHRGICLEFDGLGKLMAHAQKVVYTEERRFIRMPGDDNDTSLEKALLTKSKHWEYEQEWRLIAYKNGPGVQKFRPENLTGIIVGAQASNKAIQNVREWIEKHPTFIDLYQARVNRYKYTLDIDEVTL